MFASGCVKGTIFSWFLLISDSRLEFEVALMVSFTSPALWNYILPPGSNWYFLS
jgi:hypothetical protein